MQRVWLGGQEVDRPGLRAAIDAETPPPTAVASIAGVVDDFERANGRASGGQLWVDYSDGGHDRSRLSWTRTRRTADNHALLGYARLAAKERAFTRLTLPLAGGGRLPVDASAFSALQFEVRGEARTSLSLPRGRPALAIRSRLRSPPAPHGQP